MMPNPIRHNGERWYHPKPRLTRLRHWFLWVGGWSTFRRRNLSFRVKPKNLTPISVLGHRATLHNTGGRWWADLRTPRGYVVVSKAHCYLSTDGTPTSAHLWWWGTPRHVAAEADRGTR